MISEPARSRLRWLGPLGLLLAEYLAISLHFDALPLLRGAGLAGEFGHLGIAAPLLVVVATVTQVMGATELKAELARLGPALAAPRPVVPLVLVNVASYAGLFALTAALLRAVEADASPPLPWLLGWLALALATSLSLLFVALPPSAAGTLLKRAGRLLTASAAAGLLAWSAGVLSVRLWEALRTWTLDSVYLLLLPFTDQIGYLRGDPDGLIGVGDFFVVVAPECSGMEGIGLIVVVLAVYLWVARAQLRFPRALWLLPLGVALVWVGNSARIALLLGVGVHFSPEIALSGFHSKAGWLFFCAIALSLIAYAQRARWLLRAPPPSAAETVNLTATYLAPQLGLLAVSLATGLFAVGLDLLYGLRLLAVVIALYLYRAQLPRPSWPPSWQAPLLGVLVYAVWLWLVPRPNEDAVESARMQLEDLPKVALVGWLALRALGSSLLVPLAEELAFRGFLLRRLIDPDFSEVPRTRLTVVALAGSSLAFGLLHGPAWFPATLAGAAYALAQRVRGRTSDAVVAHAVTNGLIALHALCLDGLWLWV